MDSVRHEDIFYLLDSLEETIGGGAALPFTSRKLVDEQRCLDILDQIRVSVPEEIKAAKRLTMERERIVADARTEAGRVLADAEERLSERVSDHELVRAASIRAAEIEEAAMRAADDLRREADEYAYRVMARLRDHVRRVSDAVELGLRELGGDTPHASPSGR